MLGGGHLGFVICLGHAILSEVLNVLLTDLTQGMPKQDSSLLEALLHHFGKGHCKSVFDDQQCSLESAWPSIVDEDLWVPKLFHNLLMCSLHAGFAAYIMADNFMVPHQQAMLTSINRIQSQKGVR